MMKQFLPHVLASSLLLAGAVTQVYADINLPADSKRIQRSFVNLSFENLLPGATPNTQSCQNRTSGSLWTFGYCLFDQKWIEGWKTTASFFDNTGKDLGHREIELWKGNSTTSSPDAKQGALYAELNAHTTSTLYQNICVTKEDSFTWSLWHMARNNAGTEKISFIIADEIVDNGGSAALTPTNINRLENSSGATSFGSSTTRTWTQHKNNTPVQLSNYLGGATAKMKAFGFQAQGGTNLEGNWLDNIEVKLRPAIEFSAENNTVLENAAGTYHSVDFNIVGLVTGDFDVAFIIDNTAVSNPAVYHNDYRIFDNSSGTPIEIIPTATADPKKLSFKYKVKYNPSLNYAGGVKVTGLVIQVINNNNKEGKKVIPFALDKTQTSIAVMDLSECGGDVFDGFRYEIEDDDVDLSITKKIKETAPAPNDLVSYDMILFNDSKVLAKNSKLFDTLGANLAATANTELTCKVVDETGAELYSTCDAFLSGFKAGDAKTRAAQLLSTTGFTIGDVPENQYFKFTLTNLLVSATDKETAENVSFITNDVEVKTDSSEQDLTNNKAQAKTMYAVVNDLFNNDSGKTGTGLFVIDNGGQPLWIQATVENKAYFPLKIKNSAKLKQDYQLYASSTAVKKSRTDSLFSALVESSIQPYTDQLKIEFFDTSSAQCKAGLSGAKQVTQLTVDANKEGEVCAVVTVLASAQNNHDIWFAIESLQSGLGDVIRDAVTSDHLVRRLLELVNDQAAQINVGGTYVFPHRLINHGNVEEKNITFTLTPVRADDFLYTLFEDSNNNGVLDSIDMMISNQSFSLLAKAELTLLIKVQAPATATNGMSSQIKLEAKPDNKGQSIILAPLANIDSVTVGANQLQIHKTQFKQPNCAAMDVAAVKGANYSIGNVTIGDKDCLVYRITVTNTGDSKLTDVAVNDMYPAYTIPWKSDTVLPMTSSAEAVQDDGSKVKTIFPLLLPQEQKSLYFGIKMQ